MVTEPSTGHIIIESAAQGYSAPTVCFGNGLLISLLVHLRGLFLSIRSSPFRVAIKMDNMANNTLINYVHYIMLVCETSLRDALTFCFKPHEHYNWK